MKILWNPVLISLISGFFIFLIPRRARKITEIFSFLVSLYLLYASAVIFFNSPLSSSLLYVDGLSRFIVLFIGLFGAMIVLYSQRFMAVYKKINSYYAYVIWTIGFSLLAALSNNIILLLIAWGFLGFTLFMLISVKGPSASEAAKKTFIIIGGSDSLMVMGLAMMWLITGDLTLSATKIVIDDSLSFWAFFLIACGAFAKAGVMPFHTWVPDTAKEAPLPVTAFLPASLDKLLGIYLLARLILNVFILNALAQGILMALGAVTILSAVMMALVQHDYRKLLGYHAVSQVGYMVLGLGTGNPIGIAAGLFHMINNAIYKCCLFMTGGNVEHKTGKSDLDSMGGLANVMPFTFWSALIAAASISGIPPFNGFFSKWMIYQSLIEKGKSGGLLWIVCLVAAIFGSALTLASFVKFINAIFLGRGARGKKHEKRNEVSPSMWFPALILAALCVIFGIFAYIIPLRYFIVPALTDSLKMIGVWPSLEATLFLVIGLIIGVIIYFLGNFKGIKTTTPYIGGEELEDDMRLSGTEFYRTFEEMPFLKSMFRRAERKIFDIYEIGKRVVFFFIGILRYLHNGVLPTYLVWCLLGVIVFLFIIVR